MINKTTVTLFSLSLIALSACSQEPQGVSENLRKVGSPIKGIWHVTDLNTCETGKQSASITITQNAIETQDPATNDKTFILQEMTKNKSSKYLVLSGKQDGEEKQTSFAYADKGDKLEFSGFFINNKLLTRAKILENYNADGNALENLKKYDYVFCSSL